MRDGDNFSFVHSNNADHVIDAVKGLGDLIDKNAPTAVGAKYIGSIDPITASVFAKECGAAIGTKEYAEYADKKLKGDFSKFRAVIQ